MYVCHSEAGMIQRDDSVIQDSIIRHHAFGAAGGDVCPNCKLGQRMCADWLAVLDTGTQIWNANQVKYIYIALRETFLEKSC